MANNSKRFRFSGEVWLYKGPAAWHFVTVGAETSARIRKFVRGASAAYGSVRVCARIGEVVWETSIFPDRKLGSYLLPLKRQIRRDLEVAEGATVKGTLTVERDEVLL